MHLRCASLNGLCFKTSGMTSGVLNLVTEQVGCMGSMTSEFLHLGVSGHPGDKPLQTRLHCHGVSTRIGDGIGEWAAASLLCSRIMVFIFLSRLRTDLSHKGMFEDRSIFMRNIRYPSLDRMKTRRHRYQMRMSNQLAVVTLICSQKLLSFFSVSKCTLSLVLDRIADLTCCTDSYSEGV